MKRFTSFFNLSLMLLFITINTGCFKDGENSVTQELLRPVSVFISGNVISADSGEAVSGVQVRIQRLLSDNSTSFIQDGGSDLITLTDASGNFEFNGAIELDVDTYQHFLHISDPSNDYYTNDSQVVYSIRDAELVYKDVRVINRNPKTTTIVSGTVRNVLSDVAVGGASIRLTHATDSTIIHTTTTATDGTFAIESVDVSEYTLRVDGSALNPTAFVVEDSTVKLAGEAMNDLGNLRIAPAINADDLRVVLQWNESAAMDLDIQYTFPRPNFDFNHCGIQSLDMGASDFSVNPAYGFAAGTAYWPENMGGEARGAITDRDEPGRYTLDKGAAAVYHTVNSDPYWPGTENKYIVGGQTIAELDRNSINGSTPEVLTIHKQNFLEEYPDNMSYFYGGTASSRLYPAALGVFTVKCSTTGASIYNSGAVVKVYQGNKYLGKYSISDMAVSDQESNKKYWTVLLIEQGYKTQNATWVKPSSADDIYFRVVPYGSQSATLEVTPPYPGFYFNVTGLPYNVSYTAYVDASDYLDKIPSNLKHMKMIGTSTGRVYSMFSNSSMGNDRNYVWRTQWYGDFPGSKVSSIFINHTNLSNFWVGLDHVPTSSPWNGSALVSSSYNYCVWSSDSNGQILSSTATDEFGEYFLPNDFSSMMAQADLEINDQVVYYDITDASDPGTYFRMVATNLGPRKCNLQMGSYDTMTGAPAGEINKLCKVIDADSISDGRVLASGTNNLYIYDSNQTVEADRWKEVYFSGTTDPVVGITAMVALKGATLSGMSTLARIAYAVGGVWSIADVTTGVLGETRVEASSITWTGGNINDIKTVKIGAYWYYFYATNSGVYYITSAPGTPTFTKLSPLLDGINVLKIVDYNGKIGLLTSGNGIIIGPYPPLKWMGY